MITSNFACSYADLYYIHKIDQIQFYVTEVIAYSEAAVLNNAAIVEYCRISMAALSGGTAGLLGLTGLYGFGFYIFAVFGLWVRLLDIDDNNSI